MYEDFFQEFNKIDGWEIIFEKSVGGFLYAILIKYVEITNIK